MPPGFETDEENVTIPFNPIATNGEPFPWLEMSLPTYARPMRYMVTIHPNLTTLDVKGMYEYVHTSWSKCLHQIDNP